MVEVGGIQRLNEVYDDGGDMMEIGFLGIVPGIFYVSMSITTFAMSKSSQKYELHDLDIR